ncbi:hypothetical protein, partial [Chitinophaga sp. GbtcB8]|uniref:hypothetical protein n=1 Tax=Chitinophaga sp. GbtcB8 TaxID=2824753 RepID=UPI001C2F6678
YSLAIAKSASSLSNEINVELLSMPSSIQEVESPVPVPSSKNLPDGFEAAKDRNKEQVKMSEAIVKPFSFVALSIA